MGETIDFSVTGTILLTLGQIEIGKPLTIDGPGIDQLIIDAQNNSRVINIDDGHVENDAEVELRGLTITGGLSAPGEEGGGVRSFEHLTIHNSSIAGNSTGNGTSGENGGAGGGIWTRGALIITGSRVEDNKTGDGGPSQQYPGLLELAGTGAGIWSGGSDDDYRQHCIAKQSRNWRRRLLSCRRLCRGRLVERSTANGE